MFFAFCVDFPQNIFGKYRNTSVGRTEDGATRAAQIGDP